MKIFTKLTIATLAFPLAVAMASADTASSFKVGSCYLFIARQPHFNKGQVVEVTPQEVVFKNISAVTSTMDLPGKTDIEKMQAKDKALIEYWNSDNRSKYESRLPLDVSASYSRSEMTALELDRCGN